MHKDFLLEACNQVFGKPRSIKESAPIYQAFCHAITVFEGWINSSPPFSEESHRGFARQALERLQMEVLTLDDERANAAFDNFIQRYDTMITSLLPSSGTNHHRQCRIGQM